MLVYRRLRRQPVGGEQGVGRRGGGGRRKPGVGSGGRAAVARSRRYVRHSRRSGTPPGRRRARESQDAAGLVSATPRSPTPSLPQTAWHEECSKSASTSTKHTTTRAGSRRTRRSRAPVSASTTSTNCGSMTRVNSPKRPGAHSSGPRPKHDETTERHSNGTSRTPDPRTRHRKTLTHGLQPRARPSSKSRDGALKPIDRVQDSHRQGRHAHAAPSSRAVGNRVTDHR